MAAEQIDAESPTRKLTLDMDRAYSKGAPEFQEKKKLSKRRERLGCQNGLILFDLERFVEFDQCRWVRPAEADFTNR